ncbi:lipopolysaccharide biosynthesis protein [Aliiroseovarius sp. PTFE2010]|uniref:lipopolysaccharide biosynthesis protein n=1 Tax=Aliiroseovarius sp. PTFE2010 TaxID=3417190 RepID=UPI003CEBC044
MTIAPSHFGGRLRSDQLLAKLLRGGLNALVIKIGAAGLSFVMFLTLAKAMNAGTYGQFAFGFSLATFLAIFGSFGLRNLSLRFAAIYALERRDNDMSALVRYCYTRVLAGTGACAILLMLTGVISQTPWLIGAGLLTLALGLGELQPHILRASTSMNRALFPRDILWRLVVIAAAVAASFGFLTLGASGWLLLAATSLLMITAIQFVMSPHLGPLAFKGGIGEPDRWRAQLGGLWGSSIVVSAAPNLSVVFLGLVSDAQETGAFFAALRLAMLMNLFLLATNMIAAPLIASHHALDDRASVQRICRLVLIGVGVPSTITFLVFLAAGGWVLDLFAPGYDAAKPVLLIIAAGYLISALAGPTAQIMEMQGDATFQLKVMTISLAVALCALVPLSMAFGATGAALTLAAHTIVWNAVIYWRIWRVHGIAAGIVPRTLMERLDG